MVVIRAERVLVLLLCTVAWISAANTLGGHKLALNSKISNLVSMVRRIHIPSLKSKSVGTNDVSNNSMDAALDDNALACKSSINSVQPRGVLALYNRKLIENPYTTKIISSAIVGAIGDLLVQALENFKSGYDVTLQNMDLRRMAVFSATTGLYIAPVVHNWFNLLNKLPIPAEYSQFKRALVTMLVDQLLGSWTIVAGFFFFFAVFDNVIPPYKAGDLDIPSIVNSGWEAITNSLVDTMVVSFKVWPLINFLNFLVVPLHYRLLFANFAAMFWNMFLSTMANS